MAVTWCSTVFGESTRRRAISALRSPSASSASTSSSRAREAGWPRLGRAPRQPAQAPRPQAPGDAGRGAARADGLQPDDDVARGRVVFRRRGERQGGVVAAAELLPRGRGVLGPARELQRPRAARRRAPGVGGRPARRRHASSSPATTGAGRCGQRQRVRRRQRRPRRRRRPATRAPPRRRPPARAAAARRSPARAPAASASGPSASGSPSRRRTRPRTSSAGCARAAAERGSRSTSWRVGGRVGPAVALERGAGTPAEHVQAPGRGGRARGRTRCPRRATRPRARSRGASPRWCRGSSRRGRRAPPARASSASRRLSSSTRCRVRTSRAWSARRADVVERVDAGLAVAEALGEGERPLAPPHRLRVVGREHRELCEVARAIAELASLAAASPAARPPAPRRPPRRRGGR